VQGLIAFFSTALGQVVLALVVPIGWGLASAWVFDRFRARRPTRADEKTPQP